MKRGRPRNEENRTAMLKQSFTITAEDLELLKAMGHGNRSHGLRLLIKNLELACPQCGTTEFLCGHRGPGCTSRPD